MSYIVFVNKPIPSLKGVVEVPVSKSVANRFLVLDFLCGFERYQTPQSNWPRDIHAIWQALQQIKTGASEINIEESGTALRFLCSVLSLQQDRKFTLIGTGRIPERPMQPLVDALNEMGGQINYLQKKGFAPLEIHGQALHATSIEMNGSASSQFASALLLIAPFIEGGIRLKIRKESKSLSYLYLTLATLSQYGAKYEYKDQQIIVPQQPLIPPTIKWPSDWSSIPYFLALAACVDDAAIFIKDVQKDPSQADFVAVAIFEKYFGIQCIFENEGLRIQRLRSVAIEEKLVLNGKDYPDLIPTIICCAAFLKRPIEISAIEHLRNKESDRLAVLVRELDKVSYRLKESNETIWQGLYEGEGALPDHLVFDTESDHRMAMSLSLFALAGIRIEMTDATCIEKSFPRYWEMLSILGIRHDIT